MFPGPHDILAQLLKIRGEKVKTTQSWINKSAKRAIEGLILGDRFSILAVFYCGLSERRIAILC